MFNTERLHGVEANIIPSYTAFIRVAGKLGFMYEGISGKYVQINGKWEDQCILFY